MTNVFGVIHKGSAARGLRLISAYGKKPEASMKGLARVGGRKSVISSRIKEAKMKPANNFSDPSSS